MNLQPRTLAGVVWVGLGLWVAGRVVDLQWHATHDEFETASDQLRAHWLAWLGALVLLAAAAVVAVRQGRRGPVVAGLLVGAVGYAVVAAWHFYEHSQHRDPDLPHVLLATQILLLVGAPLTAVGLHRERVPTRHG